MIEKFDLNKQYIFDGVKVEALMREAGNSEEMIDKMHHHWISKCEGKTVTVDNKSKGWIGSFIVSPKWCVEDV